MIQVSSQRSYSGYIYQLENKSIVVASPEALLCWIYGQQITSLNWIQDAKSQKTLPLLNSTWITKGPCIYILININTSPQATEIVLWFCKGCGSSLRIGLCAGI